MRLQKGTVDGYEWRCRNQSKDNRHGVVRSNNDFLTIQTNYTGNGFPGKILGEPTAVFGAKKRQIEGFQKGVNDEKLLGSACVSRG
ncbi:hypothetical protein TNCV_4983401 [Trichonephila clavipes]|nr:hypothetical protein TNCV_4983401 [Trichonephila clavipes]